MRTKLSQFSYNLPDSLIAKYPTPERHDSRLMVVHRDTGKIEHKVFKDVLEYFGDEDVLIFNDTKVFPARMYGRKEKTGAKIEVFLLRELNTDARLWDVLVDPARKIRVGNKLYFSDEHDNDRLVAEVVDNTTSRGRTIRFLFDGAEEDFRKELAYLGNTPLPKKLDGKPNPMTKSVSKPYSPAKWVR
ncbi:MAG: S-adenosylmethionine:tRNA ribosyltransferase-isomerase [Saprospiraceae bacterium]